MRFPLAHRLAHRPRLGLALLALPMLLAAACSPGCSGDTEGDLRAHVALAAGGEGQPSLAAAEDLARFGRRALVPIEGALHSAQPSGRKNLILALRKIGDEEAVPLLRHLAIYDPAPDVRREARWTLAEWAMGQGRRAEKARAALRAIDEAAGTERSG